MLDWSTMGTHQPHINKAQRLFINAAGSVTFGFYQKGQGPSKRKFLSWGENRTSALATGGPAVVPCQNQNITVSGGQRRPPWVQRAGGWQPVAR
jgi:hypothetical protein